MIDTTFDPGREAAAELHEHTKRNVETVASIERTEYINRTSGERLADRISSLIGNWRFIVLQSIAMSLWVLLNVLAWRRHWDPYPFNLLNLVLSVQAAYIGPIVMMSQNRQNQLSDKRNRLGLQINLLAEQESTQILGMLRLLCEKQGINVDKDGKFGVFEQEVAPETLNDQIVEAAKEIDREIEATEPS